MLRSVVPRPRLTRKEHAKNEGSNQGSNQGTVSLALARVGGHFFLAFVIRLTETGDTVWTRRLGGGNDLAYFVTVTSQGTFMVGGATTPPDGSVDTPWLIELDATGQISLLSAFTVASDGGRAEMNSGSLHRYLAEAVWYPTALLPSAKLRWSAIDEDWALATLTDKWRDGFP